MDCSGRPLPEPCHQGMVNSQTKWFDVPLAPQLFLAHPFPRISASALDLTSSLNTRRPTTIWTFCAPLTWHRWWERRWAAADSSTSFPFAD